MERLDRGYSNYVECAVSLYDFSLQFGLKLPGLEDGQWLPVAHILMSPQHVKVLAKMLLENVEEYESRFGPINATGLNITSNEQQ